MKRDEYHEGSGIAQKSADGGHRTASAPVEAIIDAVDIAKASGVVVDGSPE